MSKSYQADVLEIFQALKTKSNPSEFIQQFVNDLLKNHEIEMDLSMLVQWLDWCLISFSLLYEDPIQLEPSQNQWKIFHPRQYLQQLVQSNSKPMCAYEFKPGDIAWNCRSCQADDTCVLCNDCFINSNHEDHEVFFYYTHSGGCCDCGDTEAWAKEGFCHQHKGVDTTNPIENLPEYLCEASTIVISQVLSFLIETIQMARDGYEKTQKLRNEKEKEEDEIPKSTTTLEETCTKYNVVVHGNDLQSTQTFIQMLERVDDLIGQHSTPITMEVCEQAQCTVSTNVSISKAFEIVENLKKDEFLVSIVNSKLTNRLTLLSTLFNWLSSISSLSGGLCRLISIELSKDSLDLTTMTMRTPPSSSDFQILQNWIVADALLPKPVVQSLHSLFMTLLADSIFKRSFAIAFTLSYVQVYHAFVIGMGTSQDTVLSFSVQFLNRPSFVQLLVKDYRLFEIILEAVQVTFEASLSFEQFEQYQIEDASMTSNFTNANANANANVNTSSKIKDLIPGTFLVDIDHRVFTHRRYFNCLLDLRYTLQIEGITPFFVLGTRKRRRISISCSNPKIPCHLLPIQTPYQHFLRLLSFLQGINPSRRRTGTHVPYELRGWISVLDFVSTVVDVYTGLLQRFLLNHMIPKPWNPLKLKSTSDSTSFFTLIERVEYAGRPILREFILWLAGSDSLEMPETTPHLSTIEKDFHELTNCYAISYEMGMELISSHYPLHRFLAQFIRECSSVSNGFGSFLNLMQEEMPLTEVKYQWCRLALAEFPIRALTLAAQSYAGMWVRNGSTAMQHAISYSEPPTCTRMRDLDLLLLQFSFLINPIATMWSSLLIRFELMNWFIAYTNLSQFASILTDDAIALAMDEDSGYGVLTELDHALILSEELFLIISQIITELPPPIDTNSMENAYNSIKLCLKRELIHRLAVGPCTHSDLTKIAQDCFKNGTLSNFQSCFDINIFKQVLEEISIQESHHSSTTTSSSSSTSSIPTSSSSSFTTTDVTSSSSSSASTTTLPPPPTSMEPGKFRLKEEFYSQYDATFLHLTKRQHELARENWIQYRMKLPKGQTLEAVCKPLPCHEAFLSIRLSILHPLIVIMIHRTLIRAYASMCIDPSNKDTVWAELAKCHSGSVLSRALHILTLQLHIVDQFEKDMNAKESIDTFFHWIAKKQMHGFNKNLLELLVYINPLTLGMKMDSEEEYGIGRSIEWILAKLCGYSQEFQQYIDLEVLSFQKYMKEEQEERKAMLSKRKAEAQRKAILAMQQRQAAFMKQMEKMEEEKEENMEDTEDKRKLEAIDHPPQNEKEKQLEDFEKSKKSLDEIDMEEKASSNERMELECAMCQENKKKALICSIGFGQRSSVFEKNHLHAKQGTLNPLVSLQTTPFQEGHVDSEIPVHIQLCGHAVHHDCWNSYHASQFQRVITGGQSDGQHAIDVTKGEFLCPLCKSISNLLVPHISSNSKENWKVEDQLKETKEVKNWEKDFEWLKNQIQTIETEDFTSIEKDNLLEKAVEEEWKTGFLDFCMALHRVATGSSERGRPDRYYATACHAIGYTFLSDIFSLELKNRQYFLTKLLVVMNHLPNSRTFKTSFYQQIQKQWYNLLIFGGCQFEEEKLRDGQKKRQLVQDDQIQDIRQTPRQSQWSQTKFPRKPLLLCDLYHVLSNCLFTFSNETDLIRIIRLILIARLMQSLLILGYSKKKEWKNCGLGFKESMEDPDEKETKSNPKTNSQSKQSPLTSVSSFDLSIQWLQEAFSGTESKRTTNLDEMTQSLETFQQLLIMEAHFEFEKDRLSGFALVQMVSQSILPFFQLAVSIFHSKFPSENIKTPPMDWKKMIKTLDFCFLPSFDQLIETFQTNCSIFNIWISRVHHLYDEIEDPKKQIDQWIQSNLLKTTMSMTAPQPSSSSSTSTSTSSSSSIRSTSGTSALPCIHVSNENIFQNLRQYDLRKSWKWIGFFPKLVSLPIPYVTLYAQMTKETCRRCHKFPSRPAICLVCGELLCAASSCPNRESGPPGACTIHAKSCCRGIGMFLLVLEGSVLLVYRSRAAYFPSIYVDQYGEEFGERHKFVVRGRPLFLNSRRFQVLEEMFQQHLIPKEIVKIQNSAERVIRNSYY